MSRIVLWGTVIPLGIAAYAVITAAVCGFATRSRVETGCPAKCDCDNCFVRFVLKAASMFWPISIPVFLAWRVLRFIVMGWWSNIIEPVYKWTAGGSDGR